MKIARDINIIAVIATVLFVSSVSLSATPKERPLDLVDILLADLNFDIDDYNPIKKSESAHLDNKAKMCREFHSVESGDTLSHIALSVGMDPTYESAAELALASGIQDPDKIYVGDRVCIDKKLAKRPQAAPVYELAAMRPEIKEIEPVPEVRPPEDKPKIGISVSPFLSYSRIDSTDVATGATGGVLSDAGFGAEFKIMQLWKDHFTSELLVQIENLTYTTNSGRTFGQNGGFMFNFGVGAGFRPFKKLKRLEIKARALYGDEFYFRAPDTTSLAIDSTKALKGDVALNFDIVNSKYATTGIGAGGRVIAPSYVDPSGAAGYHTKTGYGYFGSFYLKFKFKHIVLDGTITYEGMIKDTDLFEQTQSAVYIGIGAMVPLALWGE